ncbi:hypothetical protein Val02_67240 [Virgisporangium aliadipatigenens]|uniref:Uncharacterized protein n=1 Tax=Virgisporangium aliadipatigenens TaxID=741659 RepID=A0A8J3YU77_9ACTN|nr:hypothetical protein [Virgisporangium aliadipatigenens]GIJ49838.1 hypothetical protein Val02_67240 [Virgisporangium aliadipatigenens]
MGGDNGGPVEVTLAWSDERLEAAMRALTRRDARPALAALAATRDDPHRRALYIEVLGTAGESALHELRTLAKEHEDPDRWLLLGAALASAAASARGADVISRTSEEQIEGMLELGGHARRALRTAARLAPADPVPWSVLLGCAMGAVEHDGELDQIYAEVRRRSTDLYPAEITRLMSLTRKWYGSQQQAVDFARAGTAHLPPGHPLWALVAFAHVEGMVDISMRGNAITRFWRFARFTSDKRIRAEVDAAADRLLVDPRTFADHPATLSAHQVFAAFYYVTSVPERARPHLERGGPRPAYLPWVYFGEQAETFALARKEAGLAGRT